ncbi:MAG: SDR family NAD(P)-dependent oxidoreductase, partial [Candidatus Cybelea sp.]
MFEGRVALVTGGARGIGAAITEMLALSGAAVAAGYSRGKESAETFARAMHEKGAKVSIHQGRVDQAEDCNRVAKEVMEQFGRIDYLVNNAGITVDKTVRKMSVDDWRQVLDVNLSGAFQMTKA